MDHSRKRIDLTGQRYGKLTVLHPVENIGNRTAWLCRCDCGGEVSVKTYHLRGGHVTSCGCAKATCLTYIDGTCVEVLQAKTVRRNNTSGVPGVDWQAAKGLWRATIAFKGKRHYLGSFGHFEDAVKARKTAEEQLHDNFLREFYQTASAPDAIAYGQISSTQPEPQRPEWADDIHPYSDGTGRRALRRGENPTERGDAAEGLRQNSSAAARTSGGENI